MNSAWRFWVLFRMHINQQFNISQLVMIEISELLLSNCYIQHFKYMDQNRAEFNNGVYSYPNYNSYQYQEPSPYFRIPEQNIYSGQQHFHPQASLANQRYYRNLQNIYQNIRLIKNICLTVMIQNWLYILMSLMINAMSFFALIVIIEAIYFTVIYTQKTNVNEATDLVYLRCRKTLIIFIFVYILYAVVQIVILANTRNLIEYPNMFDQGKFEQNFIIQIIIMECFLTFVFLLPKIVVLSCTNDKMTAGNTGQSNQQQLSNMGGNNLNREERQ